MINNKVSEQKLAKYFDVTGRALEMASKAMDPGRLSIAEDFLDMAQRYYDDAKFFMTSKNDYVLAFAALNYSHGWLDAGARIGLFQVKDDQLFTVEV